MTDYQTVSQVICMVGGTGLPVAYSLATWWFENQASDIEARYFLLWTVKQKSSTEFDRWTEMVNCVEHVGNMKIVVHVSFESGRAIVHDVVRKTFAEDIALSFRDVLIYSSDPPQFLGEVENVCQSIRSQIRRSERASEFRFLERLTHCSSNYEC
jgi:NAD(P)H-flavin reductase